MFTGPHLKAKNIKYSNRSLLFATVHNVIHSAYKPPKQVRVDFFGQCIPIKKTTIIAFKNNQSYRSTKTIV